MKRVFFLFALFVSTNLLAQVGYVKTGNSVYDFLERMNSTGLIKSYNSFEIPKSKKEIIDYLSSLNSNKTKLSSLDKEKLNYYLKEFSFDITGNDKSIASLNRNGIKYLATDSPKYLFYSYGKNGNFFVNLLATGNGIFKSDDATSNMVFPYTFGGELKGTFGSNLGFMLRGSNGSYFGEKSLLKNEPEFDYNYKFNQSDTLYGSSYFDHSEGYLTYQSANFDFKIGRDRLNIGYGNIKTILGNVSPRMDYMQLNLRWKFFHFTYLTGKLLGNLQILNGLRFVPEKYFVYHRFTFNLPLDSQFGVGETVIYSDRGIDLSYLFLFIFFKSAEHANQDRDNTMLFIDFRTAGLMRNVIFFSQFMLDDMDFSKIGTGWYGNQTLWNVGFSFSPMLLPSDFFTGEMIRVEPYFFTNRISDNSFTNLGYPLTDNVHPNSLIFSASYNFSLLYNLDFNFGFAYTLHGANYYDSTSAKIINYGGDENLGHRTGDELNVKFLDGNIEKETKLHFTVKYEPIFDYVFSGKIQYIAFNNNVKVSNRLNAYLIFSVKL